MGVQAELMIQAAEQLKSEIIAYRRALHQQPEVGAYLPNTKEFVKRPCLKWGMRRLKFAKAELSPRLPERIPEVVFCCVPIWMPWQ